MTTLAERGLQQYRSSSHANTASTLGANKDNLCPLELLLHCTNCRDIPNPFSPPMCLSFSGGPLSALQCFCLSVRTVSKAIASVPITMEFEHIATDKATLKREFELLLLGRNARFHHPRKRPTAVVLLTERKCRFVFCV